MLAKALITKTPTTIAATILAGNRPSMSPSNPALTIRIIQAIYSTVSPRLHPFAIFSPVVFFQFSKVNVGVFLRYWNEPICVSPYQSSEYLIIYSAI